MKTRTRVDPWFHTFVSVFNYTMGDVASYGVAIGAAFCAGYFWHMFGGTL